MEGAFCALALANFQTSSLSSLSLVDCFPTKFAVRVLALAVLLLDLFSLFPPLHSLQTRFPVIPYLLHSSCLSQLSLLMGNVSLLHPYGHSLFKPLCLLFLLPKTVPHLPCLCGQLSPSGKPFMPSSPI